MSDNLVIQLISTNFVPLALRLSTINADQNETGKFWRSVYHQKRNYQGLWLVAPDGKVLSASMHYEADWANYYRWTEKVLVDLKSGMDKFGPIEPRSLQSGMKLPYWGIGVRPDGSVTLAITDRGTRPMDPKESLQPSDFREIVPDHVNLTAAEWAALAPPDVSVGSTWTIPDSVGRRFYPLLGHGSATFHRAEDVTEAHFSGRVASERDGIAQLVFEGRIMAILKRKSTGELQGSTSKIIGAVAFYNIKSQRMLSLTWVLEAQFLGFHKPDVPYQPFRFGTVVEWRDESLRRPR